MVRRWWFRFRQWLGQRPPELVRLEAEVRQMKGLCTLYGVREGLSEALLREKQSRVTRLQRCIRDCIRPDPGDMLPEFPVQSLAAHARQLSEQLQRNPCDSSSTR